MYNYKLIIEYDGKEFKGWQRQKYTKETVQDYLESCFEKILKEKIKLYGSGRTDALVSAYNQVANFKFAERIEPSKFIYSVNAILPQSIAVKKISDVPLNFHSRYSARKREYVYKITLQKKSIGRDDYFRINYDLDYNKIDQFVKLISDTIYFKSFCKNKEDKNNFICYIFEFSYKFYRSKKEIIFTISANRFLHSMVRAIIGCTLDIGRGKLTLTNLKDKFRKGEKLNLHYLPANALFLNKIYY